MDGLTPFHWMLSRMWEAFVFFFCLYLAIWPTGMMKAWEWIFGDPPRR